MSLIIYLVTTPSQSVRSGLQTIIVVMLLVFWMHAAGKTKRNDRRDEKPEEQQRLEQAIPLAGSTGVTESWYNTCSKLTRFVSSSFMAITAVLLFLLLLWAYPAGPGVDVQQMLADWLNAKWKAVTDRYSDREIFVWGKFAAFFVPYYALSLLGACLDFACPEVLRPFKIQEAAWPTLADYRKCLPLVLLNTVLTIPVLYALYPLYCHFAINPFGELPPLWEMLVQLPIFISTAEVVFYFPHKWMHTPWAFQHIHRYHHEFTSPIALSTAYAHPVEFLLSNMLPVCIGPILCGSHVTTWLLWTTYGTCSTTFGHMGYQLPFLGKRQGHDWHHRLTHLGMYDIGVGIMDPLFGTDAHFNEAWQSRVDKNYVTCDYPVDKILASQCGEGEQRSPEMKLMVPACQA